MKNNNYINNITEMKNNIEKGLVNPHISRENDGQWQWCVVYNHKEKKTYRYLWRQFDAESTYMFDRYGFAIEVCGYKFRCCICQKAMTNGGFAKGSKYNTIEEAYADIARLVEISGKAFWAKTEMRDRYWTSHNRDKSALLDAARRQKLI